jgi:hypothetical protein
VTFEVSRLRRSLLVGRSLLIKAFTAGTVVCGEEDLGLFTFAGDVAADLSEALVSGDGDGVLCWVAVGSCGDSEFLVRVKINAIKIPEPASTTTIPKIHGSTLRPLPGTEVTEVTVWG